MDAIVLAAGIGSRTKLDYPKQFVSLGGKPLFIHSIALLYSIKEVDKIIMTVIPSMLDEFKDELKNQGYEDIICVAGGETRQQSVSNALAYCMGDRVLIHAASRPFVTKEHLLKLISEDAAVVVPYGEQIYAVIHRDGYYLDRSELMNVQLPQIYQTSILKKAHELGTGKNYAEDSELVFRELGILPKLIKGLENNIKITFPLDIKIAESIYENRGAKDLNMIK